MHKPINLIKVLLKKILFFVFFFVNCLNLNSSSYANDKDNFNLFKISSGNYYHSGLFETRSKDNLGDNANTGIIIGDRCVLVIDPGGSYKLSEIFISKIKELTKIPVCYVVITHSHPDHFFGSPAFKSSFNNVKFIGHENLSYQLKVRNRNYKDSLLRDLAEYSENSDIVLPDIIIKTGSKLEVDLGKRFVEIEALEPAHTDNDLIIFDLKTKTIWLGDVLFVDHIPILDSNILNFIKISEKLKLKKVNYYVPGHGTPKKKWPEVFNPQIRYMKTILKETRLAIKKGKKLIHSVHEIGYTEQKHWLNFDLFHRKNITTAWTELEWE